MGKHSWEGKGRDAGVVDGGGGLREVITCLNAGGEGNRARLKWGVLGGVRSRAQVVGLVLQLSTLIVPRQKGCSGPSQTS